MITFLSNSALDPPINWSVLGPPIEQALTATGQVRAVAPDPVVLRRPRGWRALRQELQGTRSLFWIQPSARPAPLVTATSLLAPRARRAAFVFDVWPYTATRIGQAARLQRLDPLFVAFREGYDLLREQFPRGRFEHLPFGADTRVFRPGDGEKDIFAFWMGRRHAPLHDALERYCAARGVRYLHSTGGAITDPAELGALVARSRYFVVTPPDLDHPERTAGFSPLVMRYLEGLACRTRLLGTLPRSGEYERILPLEAILQVAPDGSDLADRLDDDLAAGAASDAVAAACDTVRREHSWGNRAEQVLARLASPAT